MNTLPKHERLSGGKHIERLMKKGSVMKTDSFRVVYLTEKTLHTSLQMAISVPRRNFQRAVDRNRIKRLVREVYRTHKKDLAETLEGRKESCSMMIVYTGRTIPGYREVKSKITLILQRLKNKA